MIGFWIVRLARSLFVSRSPVLFLFSPRHFLDTYVGWMTPRTSEFFSLSFLSVNDSVLSFTSLRFQHGVAPVCTSLYNRSAKQKHFEFAAVCNQSSTSKRMQWRRLEDIFLSSRTGQLSSISSETFETTLLLYHIWKRTRHIFRGNCQWNKYRNVRAYSQWNKYRE